MSLEALSEIRLFYRADNSVQLLIMFTIWRRCAVVVKHGLMILLWLTLLVGGRAYAQYCTSDCVPIGQWQVNVGVGLGWRTNPLHKGEEGPLVLLPEVNYYGKRFFIENFEAGWTLFEDRRHQLNLLFTPGSDQMFFNRWDPYNLFDSGGAGASPMAHSSPARVGRLDLLGPGGLEDGAGGGTSAPVSPSQPSDNLGGGSDGWSVMPVETFNNVDYLSINGELVYFEENTRLQGSSDNTITLTRRGDGWVLGGLSDGDVIGVVSSGDGMSTDQLAEADVYRELVYRDGQFEAVGDSETINPSPPFGNGGAAGEDAHRKVDSSLVRNRKMAGLAGLEYSYSAEYFDIHTQALVDVTGVHRGHEFRLAAIVPWEMARSRWAFTIGAGYKSEEILDYYYGLRESDAVGLLYEPAAAGVATLLRLDWQKPLNDKWSLRAMVQSTRLPKEVEDSPLVSERTANAFFFGGVYHF